MTLLKQMININITSSKKGWSRLNFSTDVTFGDEGSGAVVRSAKAKAKSRISPLHLNGAEMQDRIIIIHI